MPTHRQSWTVLGDAAPASPALSAVPSPASAPSLSEPTLVVSDERPGSDLSDQTVPAGLVGQVMIERAKSVVVVSRRVDEATATQILVDAADDAGIPVRLAANRIVTALQGGHDEADLTRDVLEHAVEATHPVRPREVPGAEIAPSTARAPS
ncbi:ANTAR domain-containing protein [Promicromonospora sukumoe]